MRSGNKLIYGLGITLFSTLLVACSTGNSSQGNGSNGVKESSVQLNTESQFPIVAEGEELTLSIMAPGVGLAEWAGQICQPCKNT